MPTARPRPSGIAQQPQTQTARSLQSAGTDGRLGSNVPRSSLSATAQRARNGEVSRSDTSPAPQVVGSTFNPDVHTDAPDGFNPAHLDVCRLAVPLVGSLSSAASARKLRNRQNQRKELAHVISRRLCGFLSAALVRCCRKRRHVRGGLRLLLLRLALLFAASLLFVRHGISPLYNSGKIAELPRLSP